MPKIFCVDYFSNCKYVAEESTIVNAMKDYKKHVYEVHDTYYDQEQFEEFLKEKLSKKKT